MKIKPYIRNEVIVLGVIILFAFTFLSAFVSAQEAMPATGGEASGSGGSASYTAGQVVYTTNADTSGSVIQGVQVAYEIFTIGVNETTLDISLMVFPNPTANKLILQVYNFSDESLQYQVYDIQGKLLFARQVNSAQTVIDFSSLPSATYFMHVRHHDKLAQTFKIIKTH